MFDIIFFKIGAQVGHIDPLVSRAPCCLFVWLLTYSPEYFNHSWLNYQRYQSDIEDWYTLTFLRDLNYSLLRKDYTYPPPGLNLPKKLKILTC